MSIIYDLNAFVNTFCKILFLIFFTNCVIIKLHNLSRKVNAMPEFKDMLKYFRMREGLSQSELARKLNVSASRISMYEAGNREPDFETEEKIADFFNTDLNTLRGRDVEAHATRTADPDIRRIERARNNMDQKNRDKMMKILEASFEDYFGDDYIDNDND